MNGRIDLFWAGDWSMSLPPGLRDAMRQESWSPGSRLTGMELALAVRIKQDMRTRIRSS